MGWRGEGGAAVGAAIGVHEEEGTPGVRVSISISTRGGGGGTFASAFYLPAAEQCVVNQVGEPPVQVHRCQTSFEAVPRGHQLGEAVVHAGPQASDKEVT